MSRPVGRPRGSGSSAEDKRKELERLIVEGCHPVDLYGVETVMVAPARSDVRGLKTYLSRYGYSYTDFLRELGIGYVWCGTGVRTIQESQHSFYLRLAQKLVRKCERHERGMVIAPRAADVVSADGTKMASNFYNWRRYFSLPPYITMLQEMGYRYTYNFDGTLRELEPLPRVETRVHSLSEEVQTPAACQRCVWRDKSTRFCMLVNCTRGASRWEIVGVPRHFATKLDAVDWAAKHRLHSIRVRQVFDS
jgi:hypothetical protein